MIFYMNICRALNRVSREHSTSFYFQFSSCTETGRMYVDEPGPLAGYAATKFIFKKTINQIVY
jgi:hypothetical protein